MLNGEQILDLYTIAVALGIALVIWGMVAFWKRPRGQARLLSTSQENLTGIGAFMLALCSIGLSIGFALTLSTSFFIGVLFVALFIGFCIAEFTASFHMAKLWADRRIGLVGASIWLLVGGVLISIIAGQAMIAQKVDEAEAQRMHSSAAYQQSLQARETAQERVKSLAVDQSTVNESKASLTQLQSELAAVTEQRAQAVQRREACPANWFTKCINPANSAIKQLDEKLAIVQSAVEREKAIIGQFNDYQSAKTYASELNNQPLPVAAKEDATLPGIRALSTVLSLPVETVASHVFLFLAVFGEISSIILFYLWGASRHERALAVTGGGQVIDGDFTVGDGQAISGHPDQLNQLATLINSLSDKVAANLEQKDSSKKQ